jgi:hypothetical protein
MQLPREGIHSIWNERLVSLEFKPRRREGPIAMSYMNNHQIYLARMNGQQLTKLAQDRAQRESLKLPNNIN